MNHYVATFDRSDDACEQVLVTVEDDGSVWVARREQSWHTWGPPERAEARP